MLMNSLHLYLQTNRHMLEITSMKNKVDLKLSVMYNSVDSSPDRHWIFEVDTNINVWESNDRHAKSNFLT